MVLRSRFCYLCFGWLVGRWGGCDLVVVVVGFLLFGGLWCLESGLEEVACWWLLCRVSNIVSVF